MTPRFPTWQPPPLVSRVSQAVIAAAAMTAVARDQYGQALLEYNMSKAKGTALSKRCMNRFREKHHRNLPTLVGNKHVKQNKTKTQVKVRSSAFLPRSVQNLPWNRCQTLLFHAQTFAHWVSGSCAWWLVWLLLVALMGSGFMHWRHHRTRLGPMSLASSVSSPIFEGAHVPLAGNSAAVAVKETGGL